MLQRFAGERGVTYPLLSDEGSAFIRAAGVFNESNAPDSRAFGTPHPGTFVIDAGGRVESKAFHDSNYIRDSSATALREMLGLDTALGPVAEWDAGHILLRASLDTGVFVRQRRVGWRVAIALPEGLHIYGSPVQDGFVSVGIDVSVPEGVVVDGPRYPAPEYASFPFVDGAVPVYHGVFEVTGGVTFADIREDVEVGVTVRYQACSDTECFAPAVARVSLPIRYEAFG